MYLLFNGLSRPARLIALENQRILASLEAPIHGKEFDELLPMIDRFFTENRLEWSQIEGISVIVGPIGFTTGRIITLTWNTLARVHHIPLQALDFWTYMTLCEAPFPQILVANRSEALVKVNSREAARFSPMSDLSGTYF